MHWITICLEALPINCMQITNCNESHYRLKLAQVVQILCSQTIKNTNHGKILGNFCSFYNDWGNCLAIICHIISCRSIVADCNWLIAKCSFMSFHNGKLYVSCFLCFFGGALLRSKRFMPNSDFMKFQLCFIWHFWAFYVS